MDDATTSTTWWPDARHVAQALAGAGGVAAIRRSGPRLPQLPRPGRGHDGAGAAEPDARAACTMRIASPASMPTLAITAA
ncbi:hypothetical protein HS041_29645 [Planomonospora sp. ID67723]|uniref:hypothetical protein n=1 Tax=Planomonospora sp. ID67723 TaxID=2738134 RepID=UPI0018C373D4|nr:hypothetical protein [Planomonospora sp. ID67723]MBG0831878.1 hypothetical protein [Planomonospora sp. ID67723]